MLMHNLSWHTLMFPSLLCPVKMIISLVSLRPSTIIHSTSRLSTSGLHKPAQDRIHYLLRCSSFTKIRLLSVGIAGNSTRKLPLARTEMSSEFECLQTQCIEYPEFCIIMNHFNRGIRIISCEMNFHCRRMTNCLISFEYM